ncbi:MAG: hypothetical protein ACXQTS_07220 [Candidatus Methanospirareceae archaeon]
MKGNRRCPLLENRKVPLVTVAILIGLMMVCIGYVKLFYERKAEEIAPDTLLGMEKIVVSRGEDALQRVRRSHIGVIENVKDIAIVHYKKEGSDKFLTLWVTLYPNDTIARGEAEKMATGMRKIGGCWGRNLKEVEISGKRVYQTSSGDALHYFWVDGNRVFYIIPHNCTDEEIAKIIGGIS